MSISYPFITQAARIMNSGQSRSLVLTGNVHDLFNCQQSYLPLVNCLVNKWSQPNSGVITIVYEINSPIRFAQPEDKEKVRKAWLEWKGHSMDELDQSIKMMLGRENEVEEYQRVSKSFDQNLLAAVQSPTFALEWLRQLCCCSQTYIDGRKLIAEHLLIIIEGADMLVPESEISTLSEADRRRINICQDWFSDPGFLGGSDSVVLLAESRSAIHSRVSQLPVLTEVAVPLPDQDGRKYFIEWFRQHETHGKNLSLWGSDEELAALSAGLSIHAMRQLLVSASYNQQPLQPQDVVAKVEEHIQSQLGEDVVEFKKPGHKLNDLVGFTQLKNFLATQVIPRLKSSGKDALAGAAVAGPLGSGKTYIFEAVAAELGMPVLIIKGVRSMWYGQTDTIFERLMRVVMALNRVLIFVDEADTQFGSVSQESHSTERRLTGKVQAMMSDTRLLGKVSWLLMTARIEQLSPDIRRPGRVGDLIIPVLDPEGQDHESFIAWMLDSVTGVDQEFLKKINQQTSGWSAASFDSLRREFKAQAKQRELTKDEALAIIADRVPPAIDVERRIQTLYAQLNCTRLSLLSASEDPISQRRESWLKEINQLKRLQFLG